MTDPLVSIVICTRNRAAKLPACLSAVAAIRSEIPWELVIVDNGSTDDTREIIVAFAKAQPFMVTGIWEPIAGLGRARNRGWHATRGSLIAFTDDDCYVPPDYIDRVAALFSTPGIGYGGGRLTLFDPRDAPVALNLREERAIAPAYRFVPAGFISGGNMAFRREVLGEIGGFDPCFGAGARYCPEDVDAQARASFAGWAGVFDPALSVAHHHGRNTAAARKLENVYTRGRGAYFAKFLLRRDTRYEFSRQLYWQARQTPWSILAAETWAGLDYLAMRAFAHGKS